MIKGIAIGFITATVLLLALGLGARQVDLLQVGAVEAYEAETAQAEIWQDQVREIFGFCPEEIDAGVWDEQARLLHFIETDTSNAPAAVEEVEE